MSEKQRYVYPVNGGPMIALPSDIIEWTEEHFAAIGVDVTKGTCPSGVGLSRILPRTEEHSVVRMAKTLLRYRR